MASAQNCQSVCLNFASVKCNVGPPMHRLQSMSGHLYSLLIVNVDSTSRLHLTPKRKVARWNRAGGTIFPKEMIWELL